MCLYTYRRTHCLTLFIATVRAGLEPPTLELVVLTICSVAGLRSEKGFTASDADTQSFQKAPLKAADFYVPDHFCILSPFPCSINQS